MNVSTGSALLKSVKVLISGFECFGGESVNPTEVIVRDLREAFVNRANFAERLLPGALSLHTAVLPVTFSLAYEALEKEIRSFDPDIVLSFGQAGGRDAIEFERVAINCVDADIKDNEGHQPLDGFVIEGGESAYFSTLPIKRLVDAVHASGVPARVSNSAGTYVCNMLFYRLMEANLRTRRRCGFIHVPFLPEQVASKPGKPSMSLGSMKTAVHAILDELVAVRRG